MSLRAWGWGRLALAIIGYWALLIFVVILRILRSASAAAAAYRAQHPAQQDYMVSVGNPTSTLALVGFTLVPPLLLLGAWLYTRRA